MTENFLTQVLCFGEVMELPVLVLVKMRSSLSRGSIIRRQYSLALYNSHFSTMKEKSVACNR